MKYYCTRAFKAFFFVWFVVLGTSSYTEKKYNDEDLVFPAEVLKDCIIHMMKITPTKNGSAPVIEFRTDAEFKWTPCAPNAGWGKEGVTYSYAEELVKGCHVAFGKYNHISDVVYFMCDGVHPFGLEIYNNEAEAEKLKRFKFYKFTATADKGGMFFERQLNNLMIALDTRTKLLFTYGMPTEYEGIIGGNFIPSVWAPYETAENTSTDNLKFYQYDPVGYVCEVHENEVFGVKTNVVLYDWWNESVKAGRYMKEVKKKRFMPRLCPDAETDYTIRSPDVPVVSPYR